MLGALKRNTQRMVFGSTCLRVTSHQNLQSAIVKSTTDRCQTANCSEGQHKRCKYSFKLYTPGRPWAVRSYVRHCHCQRAHNNYSAHISPRSLFMASGLLGGTSHKNKDSSLPLGLRNATLESPYYADVLCGSTSDICENGYCKLIGYSNTGPPRKQPTERAAGNAKVI